MRRVLLSCVLFLFLGGLFTPVARGQASEVRVQQVPAERSARSGGTPAVEPSDDEGPTWVYDLSNLTDQQRRRLRWLYANGRFSTPRDGADGDQTVAVIEQGGSGNTASIDQRGSSNLATILQDGTGNRAWVLQDGSANTSSLSQHGTDNVATMRLLGPNNSAAVLQYGTNNLYEVTIDRSGARPSTASMLNVLQDGANNVYRLDFQNRGANLNHSVLQIGRGNVIEQTGRNLRPFGVEQRGDGLQMVIRHNGTAPLPSGSQ